MMGLDYGGISESGIRDLECQKMFMMEDRVEELEDKLKTSISALKKLRHMTTWQSNQINDFLDETLKGVE